MVSNPCNSFSMSASLVRDLCQLSRGLFMSLSDTILLEWMSFVRSLCKAICLSKRSFRSSKRWAMLLRVSRRRLCAASACFSSAIFFSASHGSFSSSCLSCSKRSAASSSSACSCRSCSFCSALSCSALCCSCSADISPWSEGVLDPTLSPSSWRFSSLFARAWNSSMNPAVCLDGSLVESCVDGRRGVDVQGLEDSSPVLGRSTLCVPEPASARTLSCA
mmetsp:Transcript_132477/g.314060  ORF Transcript_132477/g.314060 Transcript_132477/m.314060 type:complete len:220 (-) Transcript_132477:2850-3509(-)